jgi:CMP-N,N'-diacetyllegionaminic acid synthase
LSANFTQGTYLVMSLTREDDFLRFLVGCWSDLPQPHSYPIPKKGNLPPKWRKYRLDRGLDADEWRVNSLRDACAEYFWNTKKGGDGGFEENERKLKKISDELIHSLKSKNDKNISEVCKKVFKWGGVARKKSDGSNIWIQENAENGLLKEKIANGERNVADKKVLCVLPIVAENRYRHGLPLEELGGRPLLSYAIEEAKKVKLIDRVIVDTEDEEIAEVAREWGAEIPYIRPRHLAKLEISPSEVIRHLLSYLVEQEHYQPDILLMSHYHHPFARAEHLEEAINSLVIHDCDSVISVGVNIKYHWQPGPHGLEPVLYPRKLVTDQKWITYEERGGIYAIDPNNLKTDSLFGTSVSFIEMSETEGLRIDCDLHMWMAEQFLKTGFLEK